MYSSFTGYLYGIDSSFDLAPIFASINLPISPKNVLNSSVTTSVTRWCTKSSPIYPKIYPTSSCSSFYLRIYVFKIAPKTPNILWEICLKYFLTKLSKVAQSGRTGYNPNHLLTTYVRICVLENICHCASRRIINIQ